MKDKKAELLKKKLEEAQRLANYNEEMRRKVEADMMLQIMEQEGDVGGLRQSMISNGDGLASSMRRITEVDTEYLALGQNDLNEFLEGEQMADMEMDMQSQFS